MRILVIDRSRQDGASMKGWLEAAGHVVALVGPEQRAVDMALSGDFDVVLTEWTEPRPFSGELLRSLHERDGAKRTYVIAKTSRYAASIVAAIFAAGANDILRWPFVREELLARIDLAGLALPSLAQDNPRVRPDACLAGARRWSDLLDLASEAVSGMTSIPFVPAEPDPGFTASDAALVQLTMAAIEREYRVAIAVDRRSLAAIGGAVFGSMDGPPLLDLLQEMTNTAAGAIMRTALDDGLHMTTSLPSSVPVSELAPMFARAETSTDRWLASAEPAARVHIRMASRRRSRVLVPATKLLEGMVLARDVTTESGTLLLKAGTRVTGSASQRVATFLGADCLVEVADYAA